jgi:hypothetical protein
MEITLGSDSEESANRRVANDWREGLIVVEAVTLKISKGSATGLVPCESTVLIFFDLEHPLKTETTNARGASHDSEGLIVHQTLDLSANSSHPRVFVAIGLSSSLAVGTGGFN